jgi:DNA-binding CsgD family transcriptional regulator
MSRERALLDLIGDVYGLLDVDDLRRGLLLALHRTLPSDYVSLNDIGPADEDIVTIMEPDAPQLLGRWQELAHQNPLLQHHLRTLDGRAYRFSDVIPQGDLHALELYRDVYAPMGVEHQMAFTLPAGPNRVLAIALSRRARDYSDEERELANEARPFLIQAYLNALAYSSLRSSRARPDAPPMLEALVATGLTGREAQVVRLVALGRSNQHIAAELGISDRTVGKHLEHSFRKLGVGDRSTAAGRVWEIAGAGGSGAMVGEQRSGVLAAPPDVRVP